MNKQGPPIHKEQALQKLKHYCAYAERCHNDVINKLYELNVWKKDHDEIIAILIEENYLNEERFAKAFAGGHFRTKQWGRNKIVQALRKKNISSYCIKVAMKEIDLEDYLHTLQALFENKWRNVEGHSRFVKMKKVRDYLVQKGYEPSLINELFKEI